MLSRGETFVHLPPKELAALRLLLEHAGQIVTPLQLRQSLWGDLHVTEDSVPKCVSSLRARLEPEECIQTVYKRGYRLSVAVRQYGGTLASPLPRLAILPFATEFSVPEHLGCSIAEETMARLTGARYPATSVLAQDSIFTLAHRGLSALEIGTMLRADLVLTGTLRSLPGRYRLRAEMIRVIDGTQVWVEDLLVERNRIAGLTLELFNRLTFRMNADQELWSASVSGRADRSWSKAWNDAGLTISAAASPDSERTAGSEQREAYEVYQRAHFEWQTLERHRMQDGLQHLLRATDLDPSLVAARIDIVNLCVTQTFFGFMSPTVAAEIVRSASQPLADLRGPARAMLPGAGWVSFHVDRNLPAALWAFSQSADLPHDPWTTRVRVMFALSRRRFGEAIELLRAVIELDPFSAWLQARLAWALHLNGQAAESVECIRHLVAQFPEHESVRLYGAIILSFNGEAARGVELASSLAQRLPYFDLATAVHAYALACAGRGDEARAILERLQWLSRERFVLCSFMPAVYVALGEHRAALAELENSAKSRCPWFFQMLADPRLKPLRGKPEFEELRGILIRMEADAATGQAKQS